MTFSAFFPFFAWIYIYPSWTFWCPLCQNAIFIAWGFRFSKIKYYFFFFLDPLETVYLWIKLISNMLSCSTLSVPIGIITITTASNNLRSKRSTLTSVAPQVSFARELFTISIIFLLWKPQNSGMFVIKHIKNASFISLTAEDRYLVYRAYCGQMHLSDEEIEQNSSGILRKLNDDFTLSKNITLRQIIND